MAASFKVEGFRDLEKALAQLKRGTSKGVTRRVMKKVLQPVAHDASASPFDVSVTSRLTRHQARGARKDRGQSILTLYVGPFDDDGKGAPHAHLIEFGTAPRYHKSGKYVGAVMADPFMRPAWDAHKPKMLDQLGKLLWIEIEKTLERNARRAAKAAG
jgi:hypothetical protein